MISRNKASLISAPSGCHILGLTHDLARTPAFGSSGGLSHILGSLSLPLKDPRHYPQGIDIQASPTEDILRARSYTRVYTVVYTWVYSCVHTCILIHPR